MFYKNLEVWKKSIEFVTQIYKETEKFPQSENFGLISQIRRAAVSIPSNIAEGCNRHSDKDTLRFLDIAMGSIGEIETQLIIAQNLNFINSIEDLSNNIQNISAMIVGLKSFLNNK